jgi:hypothetical protein
VLNRPELRQLKQRIALRCELRPLTQTEGFAYIAGRIRAAGGTGAQIFTREAVILMHARSRGIPRTLSVIADNALVTGFATDQRPIRAAAIEEVCRDMDIASTGEPLPPAPEPPPGARTQVLSFTPHAGAASANVPTTETRPGEAGEMLAADAEASVAAEQPKRRRFGLF